MTKAAILLALALALPALPAWAAFEDLGAGARAPGMGNAFVGVADDVYAIHYNPAGLSLLSRPELGTSYGRSLIGLSDNSNLSSSFVGYAHPVAGGRLGTAAASWEQFAYNGGMYQEDSFSLAYGRAALRGPWDGTLHAGGTGRYLRRAFGTVPEASNAMSGIVSTGRADPVLSGRSSLGAVDADFGLLYRLKDHYAAGLSVLHLMEPNVAFGSARDPVRRQVRLGLGYRSLLSNLSVQLDSKRSPAGTQDRIFTVAGERWFPRLFIGEFGVRGSIGIGTREFKQLTAGASYRTSRLGVDYAYAIPINTVATPAGSHRFAFSIRFGGRAEPDESVVMILEAMRRLKAGTVPELRALGPGLSPSQKASLDEFLALARGLQTQARYQEALDKLGQALALSPADAELLKSFGRLNFIAQMIKDLPGYRADPVQSALHQGILAYLAFNDVEAIEKAAQAVSLAPEDKRIDGFLTQLELATGIKRPEIQRASPEKLRLDKLLTQAASAQEEGRYDDVIRLALEVLKSEPDNLGAWEHLGTAYFAIGDYPRALEAWEKAFALEKNPARRGMLEGYLKSLRRLIARPKPPRPEAAPERAGLSPLEIQRLYNRGVDHYTAGELEKAKQTFQRVLQEDPAYHPASKALKRVMEELR